MKICVEGMMFILMEDQAEWVKKNYKDGVELMVFDCIKDNKQYNIIVPHNKIDFIIQEVKK